MLFCQPERRGIGPAARPEGGRGDLLTRENYSQVTLTEVRKALHSAYQWATAGFHDGNNTPHQVDDSLSRTAARVAYTGYRIRFFFKHKKKSNV